MYHYTDPYIPRVADDSLREGVDSLIRAVKFGNSFLKDIRDSLWSVRRYGVRTGNYFNCYVNNNATEAVPVILAPIRKHPTSTALNQVSEAPF